MNNNKNNNTKNRIKSKWALVFRICLMLAVVFFFPMEVAANTTADIQLSMVVDVVGGDEVALESGDEVIVTVYMDKFRSTLNKDDKQLLTTMQFFLPYDENVFEYVDGSMQNGSIYAVNALTGNFVDVNVHDHMIKVAAVYKNEAAGALKESDDSQKLLAFRLRVKDTVQEEQEVVFHLTNGYFKNLYMEEAYSYSINVPSMCVKPSEEPGQGEPEEPGQGEPEEPGQGEPEKPGQGEPEEPGQGEPEEPGQGEPEEPGQGEPEEPGQGEPEEPGQGEPEEPGQGEPEEPGQGEPDEPGSDAPGQGEDEPGTDAPGEGKPDVPSTDKPDAGEADVPGINDPESGSGIEASTKIHVSKPTGVKAVATSYNKISISWSLVEDATGYEVYRYDNAKKQYVLLKNVGKNSMTDTKLNTGKKYQYKVRAYGEQNGECIYGLWSDAVSAKPKLGTTTIKVKKNKKGTVTISWKKTMGANGYIVYRGSSKNGKYKKIKTVKTLKYINKGLSKGKKYYYKVVPYRSVNGKRVNGLSSAVKSVKIS